MQANVLSANLAFTLVNNCSAITLTPTTVAVAFVLFEEKNDDNDMDASNAKLHLEVAFTAPLHFATIATSTRIHVIVYDGAHKKINEVKAPITAFSVGAQAACPSPTAGPTATATAASTATPSAARSPTGTPGDHRSPSPSATASAGQTPH
ncbi:MAG: hypothetical protein ABR591_09085 [Candidatus Velthaea sp.]